MKQAAARDLFDYWNKLRGERCAPERHEIDPLQIRNLLADTFVLEVAMAKGFPFRLAGTRVNALFDMTAKGQSFLAAWRAEERRNIAAVLTTVADGACPVVAGAVSAPIEHDEAEFELLFLPLRHFGKTHSRILGLIKPASAPAWLGLLPLGPMSLRSLRIIDASSDAAQPSVPRSGPAIAPRTPREGLRLAPSSIAPPSRQYLRVIEGGL